ncbi:helicase [Corynebacterium frankenforstense DSM 45800]|uniref:Helicase n=1 Tax=Corynebacterium frankenforstense DSM 45800 TaxID=1437875 RepID=A0A1L7CSX9_9CORY|nr:UvrD-helicase domain-containing protein [Corynebacterium frankenforstense]APT88929.1 helicase [Corynebacterium frankenforstense DSM 45800]
MTSRDSEKDTDYAAEVAAEQAYADGLFARLDDEIAQARARLDEVQANVDPANPKAEALVQRETEYHGLNERLDRLALAQLGLVFGRIDVEDPTGDGDNPVAGAEGLDRRYIGRMGLDAREDNYRTLLLDWRAPAARPFYLATTAHPEGVRTRRHIRMRGREVTGVDDERLSGEAAAELPAEQAASLRAGVGGEAALYEAMQAARTGRMSSIVETIQREQDQIIRDPTRGVLVVEGGPGTGKTAVALHRVAYLLYTWREQLSRSGVLIVGPNRVFLDYISHVLPELGETGVVLSTVGELYPGVRPVAEEPMLGREIKGSEEMVTVLREAVRDLQVVPGEARELRIGSLTLTVEPAMVKTARTRARRSRRPHNEARGAFAESLITQLAEQMAQLIGADPLGGENLLGAADVDQLHDDLAEEPVVRDLVEELWPRLTPTGVLAGLLSSRAAVDSAARAYDEETRAALLREDGEAWTASDAALLDELAELLGEAGERDDDPEEKAERRRLEAAQAALDVLEGSAVTDNDDDQFDAEYLGAYDVLDAEALAARQEERDTRTTAERAAADRGWAYGHVVVDEAQELTPMEWRAVFRRCPARWMTLVGDIAQNGSPAGVDSWADTLEPFVGSRFRRHALSVNYRTPSEVMEVADELLSRIDPEAQPAEAIRSTGIPVRRLPAGTDPDEVAGDLRRAEPERSVAVVRPGSVGDLKGLEFDHVVVVDPDGVEQASPLGLQDLYVAVTRATRSLTLIG